MELKFVHKVSKGSRFNQIYVPKEMEILFEAGDLVEVRLLEKNIRLFYSRNFKISEFKEKLIKELFSFLSRFKDIKQVFLVGSFLTKKIDYNDIDLLIISEKDKIEEKIYEELTERFNLKFHVISIKENKLKELIEICPLTRSMLYFAISDKKFKIQKKKIDSKHINFLLMMPQDLLKINAGGRAFYDSIRRIITIERFLDNNELNQEEIEKEVKSLIPNYKKIKNNELIEDKEIKKLRAIIKTKISKIKRSKFL